MANPQPSAESLDLQILALQKKLDNFRKAAIDAGPEPEVLLEELEAAHEELRVADDEVRTQQHEIERLIGLQRNAEWARERLIAVMPVAVVVTDERGTIGVANAMAAALLGVSVDRLIRKPLFAYVHEADRSDLRTRLATATRENRDFRTEVSLHSRTGQSVTVAVAGTVRRVEETGLVEVTWVLISTSTEAAGGPRPSGPALARALVALTRLTMEQHGPRDMLAGVVADCQHAYDFPVAASITVGPPAAPDFVATSSPLAQRLDGAQVRAGEGPCQSAWDTGQTVVTPQLQNDSRWSRLAALDEVAGPTAAVGVPVFAGDQVVGALNLYSTHAALLQEASVESAELLAATVAAVLHESSAKAELESLAQNLRRALESRATIDQAKGMVMLQRGCGPDEAFRILAKMSSDQNVKLRDLAADMVARATLPGTGRRAVERNAAR